ncbi:hypothetical protein HNQ79_000951 [Streptomyces candidus]|uniref:Restriction endonuclease type IV Mrr domain-containing protein n=1 Tax=Streptomyces candidus TaxID=67283 RepID=A0A7X0LMK2_9ACTN|nr:hypothetical protein [Streptomyces candidus]GHH36508.1 hypothetical protein GCM10018773_11560 [Streptomyces candidus]
MTVRCPSCGRHDQWPQPELGCGCGAVLRIPVRPAPTLPARGTEPAGSVPGASALSPADEGPGGPGGHRAPRSPLRSGSPHSRDAQASPEGASPDGRGSPGTTASCTPPARPPFRPLTIRTARDAVTAAALYLKWLGFRDIFQSPEHPASGIDLRARGLVAQVDPRTEPSTLRDVECLWLHGLNASAVSVFFSLTGYAPEARARAEDLGLPLFVMDLTGTPQPANRAADELIGTGA